MIHKIAFPSLIIFILFLIAFAFIKASEAEMQTELAYKESVRADLMRTELQDCSAIAAEEAARAHMSAKEAEKQAQIAQHQAQIAEQEAAEAQRLRTELSRLKNQGSSHP